MADVAFTSGAPEGDANGLAPYLPDLLAGAEAGRLWPVVAVIDCAATTTDHRKHARKPKIGIRRIEIVLPDDRATMARILARALEHRTGRTVLPIDLEDQIKQAFGFVNPDDYPRPGDGDDERG